MFDFATPIDRHGTWCTQWDYVADRFGAADLLPFTISDMDFATAPCILDAVSQRLAHGVFGYSRWRNEAFLGAIAHWYASRFNSDIDPQSVVYGPSVIYMVAETIRQWSKEGDGVVVHTPAYDAFYNTITANRRRIAPVPLIPTFQLRSDAVSNQFCVQFRFTNFGDIDLCRYASDIRYDLAQFFYVFAFLTDNDTRASGVNGHTDALSRTLDNDARYRRFSQFFSQELTYFKIAVQDRKSVV